VWSPNGFRSAIIRGRTKLSVDIGALNSTIYKIAMIAVTMLAACGTEDPAGPTVPGRWYTPAQVDAGRESFEKHCAVCHGTDGSATSEWRTVGPEGHYPPPPLNGTAHTWHHPLAALDRTIRNGGVEFGGAMPGFAAILDEDERLSVIAYIQTWWTNEIYASWEEINGRSR
jgi:mono/diheme cytochrome c family protein